VPTTAVRAPRRTADEGTVEAIPSRIEIRLTDGICIFLRGIELEALDIVIIEVGRLLGTTRSVRLFSATWLRGGCSEPMHAIAPHCLLHPSRRNVRQLTAFAPFLHAGCTIKVIFPSPRRASGCTINAGLSSAVSKWTRTLVTVQTTP